MAFWSSETHDKGDGSRSLGSRTMRPHSKKGWKSNRDSEASAPLKNPPPDSASGWSLTGRKRKSS